MSQRQWTGRKIKRNHSNALPRRIIAYNVETESIQSVVNERRFSHTFKIGHVMTGVCRRDGIEQIKHYRINCPDEFWTMLAKLTAPNHTTWIVSYKALEDMVYTGLTYQFEQAKVVIDWPRSTRQRETNLDDEPHCQGLCVLENPPTILACRCIESSGRFVIVDSCNWFTLPFTDLAKGCGMERLPEPKETDSMEDWWQRCKRDCEITFMSFAELMRWVKTENMGMFRYTAAAQSMAAFRHRFMNHDILVHDNPKVKALERRGYYGGRTEVFRLGTISETCHQLDVNSLFPSVMYDSFVPFLLHRSEFVPCYSDTLPHINWADSIAEVELQTAAANFPERTAKLTIYPTGYFRTVLAGAELEHAFNAGYVKAVRSWAEYKTAILFRDYVETLWRMRQGYKSTGNLLYDLFTKRLLNSLYGKFGQKGPKWVNVNNTMAALPWSRWTEGDGLTGQRVEFRSVGWQVQRQTDNEEIEGSFVAISAFITAAARRRMDWLRWIAEPKNVYYQGVDSLIVNNDGFARLNDYGYVSETDLGKLRLQLSFNTGEIYGCNDYVLGTKTVVSGRSLDWELSETGSILQRKMASVAHLFNGVSVDSVHETLDTWGRVSSYQKGEVQADGWIKPFHCSGIIAEIERAASNANHN